MMKSHLERPSLKGTEESARQRHADLHAQMANGAAEWAASEGLEALVPGSPEARRFEMTMRPLRAEGKATSKSKKSKKAKSAKTTLRKSVGVKGPRIRVVSGGAPGLGRRR